MSYNNTDASNVVERARLRALFASYSVQRKEVEKGCVQQFRLEAAPSEKPNTASMHTTIVKGSIFTTNSEFTSYEANACKWDIKLPDAPTNLTQADLSGNVTTGTMIAFSFTIPASDGYSPITDYEYSLDNGETYVSLGSTNTIVEINDLEPATEYSITLRAINSVGAGPASSPLVVSTDSTPSAPRSLSLSSRTTTSISVGFLTPSSDGGEPITNYQYILDDESWISFSPETTSSPITITGLEQGTPHTIQLRAVNSVGAGTASSVFYATTLDVPTAPQIVSASSSTNTSIDLSFTAPSSDGGSTITNYEYSLNNGSSWNPISPASAISPVTITGLTTGVEYTIKLRAVNIVGSGAPSISFVASVQTGPSGNLFTSPATNNNVTVVAQSPFEGGGNSYSFNGTSSYLTVGTDNSWDLGTADFTIEWFQYQTDSNFAPRIFSIGSYPTQNIACSIEDGYFYAWFSGADSPGSVAPYKNQWVHFAIVRNSGSLQVYKNGVQVGSNLSNTTNITNNATLYFGVESDLAALSFFGGYLTNLRIVKGLAVYTGAFNVPTFALTTTASANPYGGSNTQAIPDNYTKLLFVP